MHNKLFLVDDALAVMGGRNIGDDYFGASSVQNFRDLDMFVAGRAVQSLRKSFELFWNTKWSIPITKVAKRLPAKAEASEKWRWLDDKVASYKRKYPYPVDQTSSETHSQLVHMRDRPVWANAEVVYDDPTKKWGTEATRPSHHA
jgi:putative cardiolipin synthase